MTTDMWVELIFILVMITLFFVCFIIDVIRQTKKTREINCDTCMNRFYYRVAVTPEQIYEQLSKGMYRDQLKYEYDPVENNVAFYWFMIKPGIYTTYKIHFVMQEDEMQMILIDQNRLLIHKDWYGQLGRIQAMNRFWESIAGATPIPYSQVLPDMKLLP